jgi:hypothetical protein
MPMANPALSPFSAEGRLSCDEVTTVRVIGFPCLSACSVRDYEERIDFKTYRPPWKKRMPSAAAAARSLAATDVGLWGLQSGARPSNSAIIKVVAGPPGLV